MQANHCRINIHV